MKTQTTWKSALNELLVQKYSKREFFYLSEIKKDCSAELQKLYPNNNTVHASIEGTMQKLRDDKVVHYVDYKGTYSWVA